MNVSVTYTLVSPTTLRIDYRTETDFVAATDYTIHAYSNLLGHRHEDTLDHELMLCAEQMTAVDVGLISTGDLVSVARTPFDFGRPRRPGERVDGDDTQLRRGCRYDHNFVFPGLAQRADTSECDSAPGRNLYVNDRASIRYAPGRFEELPGGAATSVISTYDRGRRHSGLAVVHFFGFVHSAEVSLDSITLVLLALLVASLLAFALGWLPYPFGWLVITLLLVARLLHLRQRRNP